ncbi:MAG TPA: UDP-N-acetylmuramoyl-L-alanine--D-glutamate ligase [Clostridiales bacterium]|nr:UDP-N-acetylmuramoyl-L-alanine--D-glutamate ligase [Clostridiales bacterium]
MDFTGKHVLVMGLARSGMAAIKVLHRLGARITLSEQKAKEELPELPLLEEMGVTVLNQDLEVFQKPYDLCVKNPGIPYRSEKISALKAQGIPVITEIELAYRIAKPQHYLAVTGTNGKTTTSTLLYEILKEAYGKKAHLCGNIGIPLCEIVLRENLMEEAGHYIALEVSNFQLVNIDRFHPEVATILNLSPDHVDFMGSLENYYKSKTEVYRNMGKGDLFLLNAEDLILREYVAKYPIPCPVQTFGLDTTETDNYLKDGAIWIAGEKVLPLSAVSVVGKHNLQNVMAAVSMAKAVGIENTQIKTAVENFHGVEHRIEFVREWNGIRFYNDSKGTNTDATVTALKAFDHGVILLFGGFEKGLPMEDVKRHMGCVKKAIGFGACGKRLVEETVGKDGIVTKDLPSALEAALQVAAPGDTVMLSPTTSSFDQYSCFEERGDHFKKLVNAL